MKKNFIIFSLFYGSLILCSQTESEYTFERKKEKIAIGQLLNSTITYDQYLMITRLTNNKTGHSVSHQDKFTLTNTKDFSTLKIDESDKLETSEGMPIEKFDSLSEIFYAASEFYLGERKGERRTVNHLGKSFHFNYRDLPTQSSSISDLISSWFVNKSK